MLTETSGKDTEGEEERGNNIEIIHAVLESDRRFASALLGYARRAIGNARVSRNRRRTINPPSA